MNRLLHAAMFAHWKWLVCMGKENVVNLKWIGFGVLKWESFFTYNSRPRFLFLISHLMLISCPLQSFDIWFMWNMCLGFPSGRPTSVTNSIDPHLFVGYGLSTHVLPQLDVLGSLTLQPTGEWQTNSHDVIPRSLTDQWLICVSIMLVHLWVHPWSKHNCDIQKRNGLGWRACTYVGEFLTLLH